MIANHRTWRMINCPNDLEEPCKTFTCGAFRLWKAPKDTVFDDNNIDDFLFYCGLGGVPTCNAQLNIP
jgi:hypothetical protein